MTGHEEKAQAHLEHGDKSLSEQRALLDTPFFLSRILLFSRRGFSQVWISPRKGWCFHRLDGPWQAGLSQLGLHLNSETEGDRSPVWALKGKDHLMVQTSDFPSEREDVWYFYMGHFLEGGHCLKARQIRDNQQPKCRCAPFVWQQENKLCYFSTTPCLETQPSNKRYQQKTWRCKGCFLSASSVLHKRCWFKPGCCSARTLCL